MNGEPATDEPIHVLILDDNPDDVAIIERVLDQYRRATFQITSAGTTEHCLELLQGDGADVLLLDYSLPGEDGIGFLRRLAGSHDLPPAIVITGRGDERVAAEAIASGAADYFPKDGITPSALGGAVLRAVEKFADAEQRRRVDEQIVIALATAAEAKDHTSPGHLQRLSRYSLLLARELNVDVRQLPALRFGALLHDVGKLAVSGDVLLKPGPLSEDGWDQVRHHPIIGERICSGLWLSRAVAPIVRHHHERWDGSGYVDGLAGRQIPLLARIVSVADAFDSMQSDRPYRAALPRREVFRRLRAGAGSAWDPEIVDVFIELAERKNLRIRKTLPPEERRARAA